MLLDDILGVLLSLDLILTLAEICLNFSDSGKVLSDGGHPGMTDNVSHTEALVRLVLKHIGDQVLEVFREERNFSGCGMRLFVGLPEQVGAVGHEQLVMGVGRGC